MLSRVSYSAQAGHLTRWPTHSQRHKTNATRPRKTPTQSASSLNSETNERVLACPGRFVAECSIEVARTAKGLPTLAVPVLHCITVVLVAQSSKYAFGF